MIKKERIFALSAAVFAVLGLVCVALIAYFSYRTSMEVRYLDFSEPTFALVMEGLAREGPSSALAQKLAGLPKKSGVVAFLVTKGNGPGLAIAGPVLAGDRPEMAGQLARQVATALVPGDRVVTASKEVAGPDGTLYWLTAVLAEDPPNFRREAMWAGRIGVGSFVIAWLALVFWVFSDARERTPGSAPSWGMLTLLTGPVGLGVYLVVRPAPETCPGCGKLTDPGSQFCPYCGHALRPGCPGCLRPVNLDWNYCAGCGRDLGDSS